jgi:phosphate transport system permease protein
MFINKLKIKVSDRLLTLWMIACFILIILLPVLILLCLCFKSTAVLGSTGIQELLFSSAWQPGDGNFGYLPFILSSVYVTLTALLISVPICLLTGIFVTFYLKEKYLKITHIIVDVLAGIPSVIYGVWGVLLIVPLVSKVLGPFFGIQTSGYTLLTGALVLSLMIIPFSMNILLDVFKTIPSGLSEASLSLGAGKWETIKKVVLRKAFPGIISAFMLGFSRAFGETIAVLMVVGNVAIVPDGIFKPAYPLPALIANNYGEMMSVDMYDSALMFAALILFILVLLFNLAARLTVSKIYSNY